MSAVITPYRVCNRCEDFNVGYSSKEANTSRTSGRFLMLAAPFNDVGTDGMYLSDIKVTGYEDVAKWQSNFNGPQVTMKMFTTGGKLSATYMWIDTYDKSSAAWAGGYWKHLETTKKVVKTVTDPETEEADSALLPGQCYWANTPATKGTAAAPVTISLVYNGEVIQQSQTFTLNTKYTGGSFYGVGNPLQRNIGLTELSVTGYEDVAKWQSNFNGPQVTMKKFTTGGKLSATYMWIDTYDKASGQWAGGYWSHIETGKKVVETVLDEETEEADLSIAPGDGFWSNTPATKGTKSSTVTISLIYPQLAAEL